MFPVNSIVSGTVSMYISQRYSSHIIIVPIVQAKQVQRPVPYYEYQHLSAQHSFNIMGDNYIVNDLDLGQPKHPFIAY